LPLILMKKRKPGFTFIELLMVIVIVLILAAIFTPMVSKVKTKSLEKEAISSLKLIVAAEKIYRMEQGFYLSGTDQTALNTDLKLLLPTSTPNWDYKVDGTTGSAFTSKARSTKDSSIVWCADQSGNDPTTASCSW